MRKKETADLVTFTEKIFNGKRHFLCSETYFGTTKQEGAHFTLLH